MRRRMRMIIDNDDDYDDDYDDKNFKMDNN
jgi:hypothetical protein